MWDRERGNVVTFEHFNGCFVSGNLRQLSHYPVRFFPSHTKPLALCKHRSQTSIITHGVWMRESTFQFSPILISMQYPEYADHHANRWETSITALPLVFSLVAGEWHWPQGTGLPQKIPRSVMARQRACLCIRPLSPSWPQDRCSAQSTPIWKSAFLAHTLQWVFIAWCVFSCAHT